LIYQWGVNRHPHTVVIPFRSETRRDAAWVYVWGRDRTSRGGRGWRSDNSRTDGTD